LGLLGSQASRLKRSEEELSATARHIDYNCKPHGDPFVQDKLHTLYGIFLVARLDAWGTHDTSGWKILIFSHTRLAESKNS